MRFYHFSDLNLMNLFPVFSNLKDKKIEFQDNCYCIIYMAVVSREERGRFSRKRNPVWRIIVFTGANPFYFFFIKNLNFLQKIKICDAAIYKKKKKKIVSIKQKLTFFN